MREERRKYRIGMAMYYSLDFRFLSFNACKIKGENSNLEESFSGVKACNFLTVINNGRVTNTNSSFLVCL